MADITFRPYKHAAAITGLSEIKIHELRIRGIVRHKTSGYPDYVPFVCIEDIRNWMERTGFIPKPKE